MSNFIHHTSCPACGSVAIHKTMDATDHTVSGETFEIWECGDCSLRFTQNIPDQLSIGRYYQSENYISHSDTNRGLMNSLYHLVRRRTLSSKRRLIETSAAPRRGSLLDVGSGTGAFIHYMQTKGWQVTGLEPDAEARSKASVLYNIKLLEPAKLFSFSAESIDVITLWHVLEHVHELHEYLVQLEKLLKPAGKIFIAVPNYTSADARKYSKDWAAYDVPRHLYHFSPRSMYQLLASHALQVDEIRPMWFDSFYVSMLSEKYRKGTVNLLAGSWNGFLSNLNAIIRKDKASSLIYIVSKKEVEARPNVPFGIGGGE